jgi:hypothetical protein
MNPEDVARKAADLVSGDRNAVYGDSHIQHSRAATMWNGYLQAKYGWGALNAEDVCNLMTMLKWSREMNGGHHEDNYIDGCAYQALAAKSASRLNDL